MSLSLSTRWNASRHVSGEAMIEEIRGLGIDQVELGFDLRLDLVPGVLKCVQDRSITVHSVHNYCPVPVGAPFPHPEIFTLSSLDRRTRESAIEHTGRTIQFAAEAGASVVVMHGGNVEMRNWTADLCELYRKGQQFTPAYEKAKLKLLMTRDKKAPRQLDHLYHGLEMLLPVLQKSNVRLAIEIVPQWEGIPTESEMAGIATRFGDPHIAYWHDMGHGQIRQNLGLISHLRWVEKLLPWLAGVHIHDVGEPLVDHLMPPMGTIDFARFRFLSERDIVRVLEPSSQLSAEQVKEGIETIRRVWAPAAAAPSAGETRSGS